METGHAKNVANFETVILTLNTLGTNYDPSQSLILIPALQARLNAAKAALEALDTVEALKKNALNERAAEFEDLDKLAVNIKRAAEVAVNNEAFTAALQTIVRKFQGGRAPGDKPVDDPLTPGVDESLSTNSVSQRSYDNLVTHFADLIALLNTQGDYAPNEPEYQVGTLDDKLDALQTKNNAAKTAVAAYGNALDARDEILYNPDTGLIKLVKLVKTQLSLKPGKNSSAYQQVNALEFRNLK